MKAQGLIHIDKRRADCKSAVKQENCTINQAKRTRAFHETTFGLSSYLADRHRSFYDRDFGVDRYASEAYGGDCCYYDDDNDDDDDSYDYSGDDCSDCYGDSGDNSWKGAGD